MRSLKIQRGTKILLASLPVVFGLLMSPDISAAPAQPKKNVPQHPSVKPHQPPRPGPKKPAPKRRPPGVRGMFEAAQELYDAGKYPQALQAYDALLRKYPGHEPALLQTAKTLYRLDRIKDAYNVFVRINPQHLDPETAYEYGWSFYTNKTWEGALFGFQQVPKGHALFDLANYYGGICAIKLKKYEEAEDMLEKAVVLPDKLAKSRSLYIKHVQALRLLQQKSTLAKDRAAERQNLKDQRDQDLKQKTDKPDKPEAWKHGGSKSITRSAETKYAYEHYYYDSHGLEETTYDAKVASLTVKSGYMAPLPFTMKERGSAAGIQLKLAAEDRITKGNEQRILVDESNEDLARVSSKDLGTTDVVSGIVSAEPWIELPLPEDTWLVFGGEINFTYPEFKRGKRSGFRQGYMSINGKLPTSSWSTDVSYTETLDSKTRPYITEVKGSAELSHQLMDQLTGMAKVMHYLYNYLMPERPVNGPDTLTIGRLRLDQDMPLSSRLRLQADYASISNNVFYNMPTYGQLAADGSYLAGTITASSTPLPWLSLSISQTFTRYTWQQPNKEAREVFERNVIDYNEALTAWISLNLFY